MAIPSTFTSLPQPHATPRIDFSSVLAKPASQHDPSRTMEIEMDDGSTGRGILIGMLSASSFAIFIAILIALIYFFRNTTRGRILLDRMGRPGQYDDEQAMLREEAEALETMDDMQRTEYLRAKAFIQANPPESFQTDISLSQFLAIQEKGVSAWEFEPELEIANCFVEARTEIEFYDSECSVQSNLPIPKQNEVYYWEAKIYDKPENSLLSIGVTTKPYPLFRLPGWHKTSLAYTSTGHRRFNQAFTPSSYGPEYYQGDVIGVGYRPRTGTVFFTRNGKKLDDVAHGLKAQNFFPTVGANGPCTVHVNFGQNGFVFIEANVKKWGLAPITGSLAPPPPYGSEQGSILLDVGRNEAQQRQAHYNSEPRHGRTRSRYAPVVGGPTSPGPVRSPTDISLAQLVHVASNEDVGEGTSQGAGNGSTNAGLGLQEQSLEQSQEQIPDSNQHQWQQSQHENISQQDLSMPPPKYTSPQHSPQAYSETSGSESTTPRPISPRPPVPSYDVAISQTPERDISVAIANATRETYGGPAAEYIEESRDRR
ncbi:Rsp5p-dependent ubiquitination, sorting of cargo proteins at the multivesicular body [Thelotrema lepadinum]|nr:Rsp5p-dependent ubiquitination, sorting of cargo proteins at the multivesicular body [Thelotrema lepadinum]